MNYCLFFSFVFQFFLTSTCYACYQKPDFFNKIKKEKGIEYFLSDDEKILLAIRCFDHPQKLDEARKELSRVLDPVSVNENTFYYDLHKAGVVTRTYIQTSPHYRQASYIMNEKNKISWKQIELVNKQL